MSTLGPEQIYKWKAQLAALTMPAALRIRTSYHLTEPFENWSGCRSVSRARRRHAKGIKTAMRRYDRPARKAYQMNGEIWMHPEMEKALQFQIKKRADEYAALLIQHGELGAALMLLGFGPPSPSTGSGE